ncbi:deleted in malignant brain tumors 1 protein-like [Xyrauchen texanus]|uniref:deleted in malignant brain tumors 1 protein-like n=1 Tax=Xyrauchen texanus TaxID=154827 RepID=UPI002242B4EA|nr:deleted in malignant brain tumors 1 protein-like [Xyrauchen texanus]
MASQVAMLYLFSLFLLMGCKSCEGGGGGPASTTPTTFVRLVNGPNACSGTVEMYMEEWGTVCDEGFDEVEANMICMEVGCGPISKVKTGAFFGEGSGSSLTDDLNCFGNESSVLNCDWSNHTDTCDHTKDAGVICGSTIRLQGTDTPCSGRVEIFYSRVWGTVCDTIWNVFNAAVVCREIGCGSPAAVYVGSRFGESNLKIWMDGLMCKGKEASVKDCIFNGWGVTTCTNAREAGVTCSEVRLVDGDDECSGRVEVLYTNMGWGTLCDKDWNRLGGDLICKQVNCGTALSIKGGAYFKKGSGDIWLFDSHCTGTEDGLKSCISERNKKLCSHDDDAGVICRKSKLVNPPSSNMCFGTVQIRDSEDWGTICDTNWDSLDGIVMCRELGCGPLKGAYVGSYFGSGLGTIMMDGVMCTGSESSVKDCSFPGISSTCTHMRDAGVICGEVRLVDGYTSCSGRVEVLHNNQWGTICSDSWDMTDAQVLCRELGCGSPVEVKTDAYFGRGVGKIWMADVKCSGTELSVRSCATSGWGTNKCDHEKDAGVICREVRLLNQDNTCKGTAQVYHDGRWGSVCHNNWDVADGVVLCKELGCGGNAEPLMNAYYGPVDGPIWMDSLRCRSDETNLRDCAFGGWGKQSCIHAYDAGIICKEIKNVLRIEVNADIDPNNPEILNQIMDLLKNELQKTGNFNVLWRTHHNNEVFKEKKLFDP